jgi:hypothetical protein
VSVVSCTQFRNLAPELSLEVLGGAERAEALDHAEHCAVCRSFVAELSETVDALSLLLPEVEPPPGFATRTLGALGPARSRRPWRWGLGVAAAAAAIAAASAVVSIAVVRMTDRSSPVGTVAPVGDLREAPMMGAGGRLAGRAYAYRGRSPWLLVSVDYGVPAGAYGVEIGATHGSGTRVGTLAVSGGRGSWGGTVDIPPSGLDTVRIVGADGRVVCEARFGSRAAVADPS